MEGWRLCFDRGEECGWYTVVWVDYTEREIEGSQVEEKQEDFPVFVDEE